EGKAPLVGGGAARRSMSYIDNTCQALLLAERSGAARGHLYWVADRRPYTMSEIIDTVERLLEHEFGMAVAHRRRRLPALASRLAPERPAGIEYLRADILDAARVAEAMAGVDVVHHHAALVPLTKAGRRLWRVNVDGTQQALDAARAAGVKFFIHVSTSAV